MQTRALPLHKNPDGGKTRLGADPTQRKDGTTPFYAKRKKVCF
jgi:hypothetical protein